MRSAPSPKKKTSPVVWAAIVAGAVVIYMLTAPSDAPTGLKSSTTKKRSTTKSEGPYLAIDTTAKFPPVTLAVMDAFKPAVRKAAGQPTIDPTKAGGGIAANLTGGEANWYYTGLAELNGRKHALLENTTTGETVYVSPGEGWKAARVASVDISALVLIGPDGASVRVPIQQYGEAPAGGGLGPLPAVAGTQPLNPTSAVAGVIGNNLNVRPAPGATATVRMPNGQTVQVPLDTSVTGAQPNNDNGNGRRRRRNRTNNPGDQINVP